MARSLQSVISKESQISNLGLETLTSETHTTSGTFTLPVGFKGMVYVTLVAGGGGGGGEDGSSLAGAGGGGGAGYYRWPIYLDQTVTTSVSVTVGTGGALGAGGGGAGGPGIDSSFGAYLTAYAGAGGTNTVPGLGGGFYQDDIISGSSNMYVFDEFPAWKNIMFGAYSEGAEGGAGEGAGEDGSDAWVKPNSTNGKHVGMMYSGEGEPAPDRPLGGLVSQSRGGGGGAGYGAGGYQANAPTANEGGGGKGDDTVYPGQAGAAGKCVLEWFE